MIEPRRYELYDVSSTRTTRFRIRSFVDPNGESCECGVKRLDGLLSDEGRVGFTQQPITDGPPPRKLDADMHRPALAPGRGKHGNPEQGVRE